MRNGPHIYHKLDKLNKQLDKLNKQLDKLNKQLDKLKHTQLGMAFFRGCLAELVLNSQCQTCMDIQNRKGNAAFSLGTESGIEPQLPRALQF